MSIQWTLVAGVLYAEIALCLLLLLPWIRPYMWNKLFKSRIFKAIEAYGNVYSWVGFGILLLLFCDAVREVRKYADVDQLIDYGRHAAEADAIIHMKLFRAQRNLYISGFALFLWLLIRRLITLISREAQLQASAEAAMKQAQSATNTAKNLLDGGGDDKGHVKEIEALNDEIETLRQELKTMRADRNAMKAQAENLQLEYERLADELADKTVDDDKPNKKDK